MNLAIRAKAEKTEKSYHIPEKRQCTSAWSTTDATRYTLLYKAVNKTTIKYSSQIPRPDCASKVSLIELLQ